MFRAAHISLLRYALECARRKGRGYELRPLQRAPIGAKEASGTTVYPKAREALLEAHTYVVVCYGSYGVGSGEYGFSASRPPVLRGADNTKGW